MHRLPIKPLIALFFSLFITLTLTEIALRTAGHIISQKSANDTQIHNDRKTVILILGESTSAPLFVSWPKKLQEYLDEKQPDTYTIINRAVGGTNTAFIAARLKENLNTYKPDIVITMMGANDKELLLVFTDSWLSQLSLTIADLRILKALRLLWRLSQRSETITAFNPTPQVETNDYKLITKERELRAFGKYEDAKKLYTQNCFTEQTDTSYRYCMQLGQLHMDTTDFTSAREAFIRAVSINPSNSEATIWLAKAAYTLHDTKSASEYLRLAEDNLLPEDASSYVTLADMYEHGDHDSQALMYYEHALLKLDNDDNRDRIIQRIIQLYHSQGIDDGTIKQRMSTYLLPNEQMTFIVDSNKSWSEITRYHYQYVARQLAKHGIRHIAMQYPNTSTDILQSYLKDTPSVVLSNERLFEEAMQRHSKDEIFYDLFGGSFGHTTPLGDELIAKQLSEAILTFHSD